MHSYSSMLMSRPLEIGDYYIDDEDYKWVVYKVQEHPVRQNGKILYRVSFKLELGD